MFVVGYHYFLDVQMKPWGGGGVGAGGEVEVVDASDGECSVEGFDDAMTFLIPTYQDPCLNINYQNPSKSSKKTSKS